MTINLTAFQVVVDTILKAEDNEFDEPDRQEMIKSAVERYSHDLPDYVTEDITGDAGKYYAITTSLTSWSEGFSQIQRIEYPAPTVASDEPPQYLDPEDWDDDYWDGTTRYLYLPNHAPAATEALRVRYTAPYTWTTNAVDVPPAHFYAICNLAASLCAQAIADKYSRSTDSTISADSVEHLSKAQQWAERARELMSLYRSQLNISEGGDTAGQAAGEFVDWDTKPSGRQYLYHGMR